MSTIELTVREMDGYTEVEGPHPIPHDYFGDVMRITVKGANEEHARALYKVARYTELAKAAQSQADEIVRAVTPQNTVEMEIAE